MIPKAPLQQIDLDVMMKFFFNDNGEHVVLGEDTDEFGKRTITFGTPSNMKYFSETNRINIDCTYKSAPSPDWASVLILLVIIASLKNMLFLITFITNHPSTKYHKMHKDSICHLLCHFF